MRKVSIVMGVLLFLSIKINVENWEDVVLGAIYFVCATILIVVPIVLEYKEKKR